MHAAARVQPVRTYLVEILPDDADVEVGDPIFSRLATAADRILENPAFDPADTNLVVTLIYQALARAERRTATALHQAELHRRDELIREIAATYEGSVRARALKVVQDVNDYASRGWRRHRVCAVCPEEIVGTRQALFWSALRSHPYFPTSARQVENIIR
jgi:hypothetical protein